MTGEELINKIIKLGKEKEVIIHAFGACEGMLCEKKRKIEDINLYEDKIIIRIDVDIED